MTSKKTAAGGDAGQDAEKQAGRNVRRRIEQNTAQKKGRGARRKGTTVRWGNVLAIAVVLGILAFMGWQFFFAGLSGPAGVDLSNYNGYAFMQVGDAWFFDYPYGGEIYSIPLYYHPAELADIPVDKEGSRDILRKERIYITVGRNLTSYATLGAVELAKVFGKAEYGVLQKDVRGAVPYDTPDVPRITCGNASDTVSVISMRLGTQDAVFYDDGCIVAVSTDDRAMRRVATKLVYVTLGVMS